MRAIFHPSITQMCTLPTLRAGFGWYTLVQVLPRTGKCKLAQVGIRQLHSKIRAFESIRGVCDPESILAPAGLDRLVGAGLETVSSCYFFPHRLRDTKYRETEAVPGSCSRNVVEFVED